MVASVVIGGIGEVVPRAAGAATRDAGRTPSPCALLRTSEIEAVGPHKPVRRPIPTSELFRSPPGGIGCDWISVTTAHQHSNAIFGVAVAVWDFRNLGASWTGRWGTKAARYVRSVCTQQAPPGSGVSLPIEQRVSGVGDYACTTGTGIHVAKGPFFLALSVGTNHPGDASRQVLRRLVAKAVGRLRA